MSRPCTIVTGSVIADARGPFLRSALINLGRDNGVRVGYAVIDGDGLIGRVVDAGSSVARVLLLSDLNSRIPVLVGPAGIRALVSGDNAAELKLEFLPDGASLYAGDEVYTSGSEGVLPRGLRVGVVTGAAWRLQGPPLRRAGLARCGERAVLRHADFDQHRSARGFGRTSAFGDA